MTGGRGRPGQGGGTTALSLSSSNPIALRVRHNSSGSKSHFPSTSCWTLCGPCRGYSSSHHGAFQPPLPLCHHQFCNHRVYRPCARPLQQQHQCHQQPMCLRRGPGGLQSKDVRWNGCRNRRERENYNFLLSLAHPCSIRLFDLRHRRLQSQCLQSCLLWALCSGAHLNTVTGCGIFC
jgi:hypothetical protein